MRTIIAVVAFGILVVGPARAQSVSCILTPASIECYCGKKCVSLEKQALKKACKCEINWGKVPTSPTRDAVREYCLNGFSITGRPAGVFPKFDDKVAKLNTKTLLNPLYLTPCPLPVGYVTLYSNDVTQFVQGCCHDYMALLPGGCANR